MPKSIDDPELIKKAYGTIEEAIVFHKCLVDRTADAVCWENLAFKKMVEFKLLKKCLPQKNMLINEKRSKEIQSIGKQIMIP